MADAVDWNLATALGSRVVGGGPRLTPEEANQIVAELYYLAGEATPLVQETTGLDAYLASEVQVVDRPEWIRSNVDSFKRISTPLTDKLDAGSAWVREFGSRATGVQLGLVRVSSAPACSVSSRSSPRATRLLLVAPNIVEIERHLEAVPRDFRLWVCVHEQTHRIQFAAAPWLTDYLLTNIHEYMRMADMTTGELLGRVVSASVRSAPRRTRRHHRRAADAGTEGGLRQTHRDHEPAGGARRRRDGRGRPQAIPTVRSIRAAFQRVAPTAPLDGRACCDGCSAWTSRPGSTRRARRSSELCWPTAA
ncbi:MAG: zinc-dependent metalloprotease [Candidatus Nanopelagicales bacterium]